MPPNVVMFVADQLRCDALSCYGNAVCRTPNLDALAAGGVRFDRAYATSPVCSPSRASLLSGLYPHNHGVMVNTHIAPAFSRGLSPETATFSRLLRDAGYALDYVGKWHVHADLGPGDFGFERHVTPRVGHGAVPGTEIYIDFPGGRQLVSAMSKLPREQCEVWRYAQAGVELIRERAAAGRPFFLRIDTNQPHFANVVPEPYATMYAPEAIPPWPNFEETFDGKPAGHLRKHREWNLQDKSWEWWSRVVAKYFGNSLYTWTGVIGIVLGGISLGNYIGGKLADRFKPNLAIMHPLPRRHEIDKRLDDDPRAKYFDQVRNGMWMRTALIAYIFNIDGLILDHYHSYYSY